MIDITGWGPHDYQDPDTVPLPPPWTGYVFAGFGMLYRWTRPKEDQ